MGREVRDMTICSEQERSFWMDIHGELGPEDRDVWETHLAVCDACREEKAIAVRMMGQIKAVLIPPPLPHTALTAGVDRIAEKSRKQKAPSPAPKPRWFMPAAVRPAFAAVCLLLVAIGIFSVKSYVPNAGQPSIPVANLTETLPKEDLEVIENMELLEEFETIQQLVQVMEDQNNPPNRDDKTQGEIDGGRKLSYG
jgi:hypothetical protein